MSKKPRNWNPGRANHPKKNESKNQNEPRDVALYRLVPIAFDGQRAEAPEYLVEGELHDRVVVSVPVTTTASKVEEISRQVGGALNRPILVVSHNVALLSAQKLSPEETLDYLARGRHGAAIESGTGQ